MLVQRLEEDLNIEIDKNKQLMSEIDGFNLAYQQLDKEFSSIRLKDGANNEKISKQKDLISDLNKRIEHKDKLIMMIQNEVSPQKLD